MKYERKLINLLLSEITRFWFLTLLSVAGVFVTNLAGAQPFAYVANSDSDTVSVIDTAINTVVGTVIVGDNPRALAITPDGTNVYVANFDSNDVSVIDTATNTVVSTIALPVGIQQPRPRGIAITPNGTRAYVTNQGSNDVSVIDTTTKTVLDTVDVGSLPIGVAITPDGSLVYVLNVSSNNISVIDTASNTMIDIIVVDTSPRGIAITPDGSSAYVTHFTFFEPTPGTFINRVSVIDIATSIVNTVEISGFFSYLLAITPDGSSVYVANASPSSNNVSVIDTTTNTEITTIPVGSEPGAVAFTPDGTRAYVTNNTSNNVSVIDTLSNTVLDTIDVGNMPREVAIAPMLPPTIVSLVSFTVETSPAGVTLAWETATEIDNAGFNIWRSESETGKFVRINEFMIPAEGGETWGAKYSFMDTNVPPGTNYYYKLEDVEFDGDSNFHGPISVKVIENPRRLRIRDREDGR